MEKNEIKKPKRNISKKKKTRSQSISNDYRALLSQAVKNHQLGLLDQAIPLYRQILSVHPNFADANHLLGVAMHAYGDLEEAVNYIKRAIKLVPDRSSFHNNLGNLYKDLNLMDEAVVSLRRAIIYDKNNATYHINLGNVLNQMGRYEESGPHLKKAAKLQPNSPEVHNNLGLLYQEGHDQLNLASDSFLRAISLRPEYPEALYNLGNVFAQQFRLKEAVDSFQKAINLKPDYLEALINLGNTFTQQEKPNRAIHCYKEALKIFPKHAELLINLGNAQKDVNDFESSILSFKSAIEILPDNADAYFNLANVLFEKGDIDGAHDQLDLALSYQPKNTAWRIRQAIMMPVIPSSEEDILLRRKKLKEKIKLFKSEGLSLIDPLKVGVTNFYLTYHNIDNKQILQEIAGLYSSACPSLSFQANHCVSIEQKTKHRIKIGFLSNFFWEHTIGKLSSGIIQNFSHDLFEIVIFQFPGKKDHVTTAIEKSAERVVPLVKNLEQDRKRIAKEELDILFYPDLGMDPYTYFLSFSRLAPLQTVSWGHPETVGSHNIDYFISSDLIEAPGSAEQYREKLISISLLPTYYYRPKAPKKSERSDYSLPDTGSLYICPQTLFKFHPSFDSVIAQILHRDISGYFVMIDDGKGGYWNKLLIERIGKKFPDIIDRIVFVHRMSKERFMGFLQIASVVLDIPSFSGGNSSLEAFAMGVPIVTYPGKFMRSQVTAGCYKQMGLDSLIASSNEEYISIAIKLAKNKKYRKQMQKEIIDNSYKLFERQEVINELEAFFIGVSQNK